MFYEVHSDFCLFACANYTETAELLQLGQVAWKQTLRVFMGQFLQAGYPSYHLGRTNTICFRSCLSITNSLYL